MRVSSIWGFNKNALSQQRRDCSNETPCIAASTSAMQGAEPSLPFSGAESVFSSFIHHWPIIRQAKLIARPSSPRIYLMQQWICVLPQFCQRVFHLERFLHRGMSLKHAHQFSFSLLKVSSETMPEFMRDKRKVRCGASIACTVR